jgi:hypothetical protein
MALLELDQSSFRPMHRLNMHKLIESWLPGMRVPKRDDYMAGGRWARQSYYEAVFSLAKSILEDAECYMALNSHLQRFRHASETDPIPQPRDEPKVYGDEEEDHLHSKHQEAVENARRKIEDADWKGQRLLPRLLSNERATKKENLYKETVRAYKEAFQSVARVLDLDKLAFHSAWFRVFYQRNYNALMVKSVYDNVIDDVDEVRYWYVVHTFVCIICASISLFLLHEGFIV